MEDYRVTQTGDEIQEIFNQSPIDTADIESLKHGLLDVEGKIPPAASAENPLTDKQYVDDSIASSSATFRGTYNEVADLELSTDATHAMIAYQLSVVIDVADNNDYAFVQIPTSAATPTEIGSIERYKFVTGGWEYEYTLNNSGFTADQWAAINSGITSGLVTKLTDLPTNAELTTLLNGKANAAEVYTKSETYNKTELDSMITTPDVQYVSVTATAQTTSVTDVLPATGAADTVYRVGSWDGTQYDANSYSEYAWDGTAYVLLNVKNTGIATGSDFDNPTATQRALLATVGAVLDGCDAVPTAGSVKPLQSGGAYTALNNVAFDTGEKVNEVSIEDNLAPWSENLLNNGGVYDAVTDIVGQEKNYVSGYLVQDNGHISSSSDYCVTKAIPVTGGDSFEWYVGAATSSCRLGMYNSLVSQDTGTFLKRYVATSGEARTVTVEADTKCIVFTCLSTQLSSSWAKVNGIFVWKPLNSKTGVINERIAVVNTNLAAVDTKVDGEISDRKTLSLLYDSTIMDINPKGDGTIRTSGARAGTDSMSVWFIKNHNYSNIEVNARLSSSYACLAFYNSESPSAESLIEGQSYPGTGSMKKYTANIPVSCKLIGISTQNNTIGGSFYYKIWTKNSIYIGEDNQGLKDLQIIYDETSFESQKNNSFNGTTGALTTATGSERWLIKNNKFKYIEVLSDVGSTLAALVFYNSTTPSSETAITVVAGNGNKTLQSYTIPDECKLIGISTKTASLSETPPAYFKIYVDKLVRVTDRIKEVDSDLKFKIGNSTDIISLNSPLDMGRKLNHLSKEHTALTLLHFSDLHHDIANLRRVVQFRDKYSTYITDSICTGDLVYNLYSNPLDWSGVEGSETILRTIGNHETALTENNWSTADADDVYDKFLGDAIDNWSVVHEGKKHYYYKDYASQGIRLIVLDPYYDLENQNTWLQGILAETLDENDSAYGYSVIIAEHNPFATLDFTECSFTDARYLYRGDTINSSWGNMIAPFVVSVDSFQNNDGKFICWIAGHIHHDMISVHHSYPNQLMLSVSCATNDLSESNINIRTEGTKDQDNFNIYSFDTTAKVVTILKIGQDTDMYLRHKGTMCISYDTKEVLWNE